MDLPVKPLAGMRQLYPDAMAVEEGIAAVIRRVAVSYGFEEYDGPVIEPLELFLAKSGSELVMEQSYRFTDRGGREVVLRPEMTPTLARMIAGAPDTPMPARWMSFPVCFRYERPQRGRVREFRQFNCDILGSDSLAADAEVVAVLDGIMRGLGAPPGSYSIRYSSRRLASEVLASLGVAETLHQKALAIIDRKSKLPAGEWRAWASETLGGAADSVERFSSCSSLDDGWLAEHGAAGGELERLREFESLLAAAGVGSASFDAGIARGLDYYTGIVFELLDAGGENRRAICGGGRYDNLVGIFGGKPVPGVGFGLGMLTLKLFLETLGLPAPGRPGAPDVFMAVFSPSELPWAVEAAEAMRSRGLSVLASLECGRLARQFREASRRGASFTAVAGPEEAAERSVTLKDMSSGEQARMSLEEALDVLTARLAARQPARGKLPAPGGV